MNKIPSKRAFMKGISLPKFVYDLSCLVPLTQDGIRLANLLCNNHTN